MVRLTSDSAPWIGVQPYRAENAHLFFGRAEDTSAVVTMALSHRLSLLHAQSGAGKSSLLNAAAIPAFEELGWFAATSRPWFDPIAEIKDEVIRRVFPDLELEVAAIDRAIQALSATGQYEDPPFEDMARSVWAALEGPGGDQFNDLLKPFWTDSKTGDLRRQAEVTPLFVRSLQSRGTHLLLARHLHACDSLALERQWTGSVSDVVAELASTRLSALRTIFLRSDLARVRAQLLEYLAEPASLATFFTRLDEVWGSHCERFGIVLVLDQFEEMFTRFAETGTDGPIDHVDDAGGETATPLQGTSPDWRARGELFEAMAELLAAQPLRESSGAGTSGRLPIRIVLAMRDDHVADLDQLMRLTGPIRFEARYHLRLLEQGGAVAAMREPARVYGWRWNEDVFAESLRRLQVEGQWVHPAQLQIICRGLWDWTTQNAARELDLTVFEQQLGGVKGILEQHLLNVIAGPTNPDELDQHDIIEMLEPLITKGRRRNIVESSVLVAAPYRIQSQRERLLQLLELHRIVRVESRYQSRFVEITHEFLIQPVLDMVERRLNRSQRWRDVRAGIARLQELQRRGFRSADLDSITGEELEALLWYRDRLDLHREPWIVELIYRASVEHRLDPAAQAVWRARLDENPPKISAAQARRDLRLRIAQDRYLDSFELRALKVECEDAEWSRDEARFLLLSAIANCDRGETALVVYWAKKAANEFTIE